MNKHCVQHGTQSLSDPFEHVHTIKQLAELLKDHGYASCVLSDAGSWLEVRDWRIERTVAGWRVGYLERGKLTGSLVDSNNKHAAIQRFLQTVASEIYHLRTFHDDAAVGRLEVALAAADVPFQRNDVPFEHLLRIFVAGRHLRRAQEITAIVAA